MDKNPDIDSAGLTEHSLRGEVQKVLYESGDGSYAVLRVLDAQGVENTVVGAISGAYQGQGIEVSGIWETHKEHGRQLRASSYKFVLPATPEGIKRYLCSGVLPGIGETFAQRIVDAFGVSTLEVLDRFSGRLREVPGLGRKKIEKIRTAWQENTARRNTDIFLQGLGITAAFCRRIYKSYGDNAAEVVKENPYRLADDVDGIGFLMADRVAAALNIGKTDEKRLRSGILYALNQIKAAGHTCYPADKLVNFTAELLDVSSADAGKGLESAIASQSAVVFKFGSERMLYLSELFAAESELPVLLGKIYDVRVHAGSRMAKVAPLPNMNFSDEQLLAVKRASESPFSIITGGPGVGKTTVIGEIVRRAALCRLKVLLAAPTGRAAKRLSETSGLSAMTIHRMLKWEPAEKSFVYGLNNKLKCDLLIVDETSMLDISLAVHLLRAVKPGSTLIFVGDSDQLPSVGPGRVLNDLIDSRIFPVTHLRKIFRQGAGSRIVINAHSVNGGYIPERAPSNRDDLSDFYWIEQEEPEKVAGLIMKLVKERIPKRFGFDPMKDIQVLSPMNKGQCGTFHLNEMLQSELNAGNKPQVKLGERTFKIGDKVMQTANNYDKKVFNGDMGRVSNINIHDNIFSVLFDDTTVNYELTELDQLTLSYAVTVHKAQGCEFPAVIVPILSQHYMMLQRKLLYTAMTRARRLLILIGGAKAVSMAVRNVSVEPRYSMLIERLNSIKGL